ncbi:MAG: hypothetical protein WAO76_08010 [Georgfuchsia sp.]
MPTRRRAFVVLACLAAAALASLMLALAAGNLIFSPFDTLHGNSTGTSTGTYCSFILN